MKISKLFFILSLVITLPFYSCGKSSDEIPTVNKNSGEKDVMTMKSASEEPMNKVQLKPENKLSTINDASVKLVLNTPETVNRMIIKTGTMNLETEKYDETINQINEYVKNAGGYITNSNTSENATGKKFGSVTIRIFSDKYDAMLKDLSKFGKVQNSQINGNDVTSEYIDLQARMTTQSELEKRLLTLLNEKTAKLIDVVEVEEKLAEVRESIEQTQGRMKYLKNQADFSTLTVSVYEPSLMTTSSGGGFFYEISRGFSKGLKGFTEILSGMITFSIALLPIIVLLVILAYTTIFIYKKSKARRIKTA